MCLHLGPELHCRSCRCGGISLSAVTQSVSSPVFSSRVDSASDELLLAPVIAARFKVEHERFVCGLCRQLRPPRRPRFLKDIGHVLREVESATILINKSVQRLPEKTQHRSSKLATLDPARHELACVAFLEVTKEARG